MPSSIASRRCVALAGFLAVAIAASALLSPANAQADRRYGGTWTAVGPGDCTGKDSGQSDGVQPQAARCLPASNNQVAVCWDGVTHKHPVKAGAWCTYKSVTPDQCQGGTNTGIVYRCTATAAAAPPPAPHPPTPPATRATGWVPRGIGDCSANDFASSDGIRVDPGQCTPQTVGQIAVCWDGSNTKNVNRPNGWCTYKTTPLDKCTGGGNPGMMHECRYLDAAAPPQVTPPPPPPPQVNTKFFAIPMWNATYAVTNCLEHHGLKCGQPAADAFCRKEGFARAADNAWKHVWAPPTGWIINANEACTNPGCARLADVTCVRQ